MTVSWYLLQSKPREEGRAHDHLIQQGYDVFWPQVEVEKIIQGKIKMQTESMFAGYLFVKLSDVNQNWAPIRSTRGVSRLVRFGSCAAKLSDAEINSIAACAPEMKRHRFEAQQLVEIVTGPFKGLQGIFERLVLAKNGQERALVLMELMGAKQLISLELDAVKVG